MPITYTDILGKEPARAYLSNIGTGEIGYMMLNPDELRETHKANYHRRRSPGLSHQRLNYMDNDNVKLSFKAVFDEFVYMDRGIATPGIGQATDITEVERSRRFLLSLINQNRGQRLPQAAPPAVLFVWPDFISMRVRLTNLEFVHQMFSTSLSKGVSGNGSVTPRTRILVANISLEETPLARIYSDDMALNGTLRSWAVRR